MIEAGGSNPAKTVQGTIAGSLGWLRDALAAAEAAAGPDEATATAAVYDATTESVTVQWHGTLGELAELMRRLS